MRMFVELALGPEALDRVWAVGRRMQSDRAFPGHSVRWVKREALHLTLRFLGEVEQQQLPEVIAAIGALEDRGRFELRMTDVGSFGRPRPRVVWVGLAQDDGFERLQRLRAHLDDSLREVGFDAESGAFRPHLTLGRVRRRATSSELAAIRVAVDGTPSPCITSLVERVALVESTLLTDGPRYRRLAIAEL